MTSGKALRAMIWAGALATGGWLAGSGMAAPPQRAEEHAPPRPGHSPYQLPLRPLDAWVYRQNWQRETDTAAPAGKGERRLSVTIMATAGDRARVSLTEMGAASPAIEETVNADWSCAAPGTQGHWLTSRPLALPLWPGKMWEADYTARTPADPSHTRETIRQHYHAVGWEEVRVAAGSFWAMRIEEEGEWIGSWNSSAPRAAAASDSPPDAPRACRATQPLAPLRDSLYGRYHKLYWYAPAAKRWVKLVERYDDINGDPLARSSMELESYRLSS